MYFFAIILINNYINYQKINILNRDILISYLFTSLKYKNKKNVTTVLQCCYVSAHRQIPLVDQI